MLIVQLSDPHIRGDDNPQEYGVDNNRRLEQAIESVNAESIRPDAVVVTGDLTMSGKSGQYQRVVDILAELNPDIPVLPLGGNHDDRGRLKAAFPHIGWADADHASWSIVIEGVRIIGLDSTIPKMPGAHIGPPRAKWLANELSSATEPVLLAMHHPPFMSGIAWMDEAGFDGLDRFIQTLEDYPKPGLIICGHLHRPIHSCVAGVRASVGISTIQHVALDLDPDGPSQMILDPVGYQLHCFDGSCWTSHTRFIDSDAEPMGLAPYPD